MPYTTQQVEQIFWAVGHRCSGQQEYIVRADQCRTCLGLNAQQFQAMTCSFAGVLNEVGFIENNPGPVYGMEAFRILAEQIIIYDYPTRGGGLVFARLGSVHGWTTAHRSMDHGLSN